MRGTPSFARFGRKCYLPDLFLIESSGMGLQRSNLSIDDLHTPRCFSGGATVLVGQVCSSRTGDNCCSRNPAGNTSILGGPQQAHNK